VWLDYDPTGYVDVSYSSALAVIRYSAQSSSTVPSKPSAATGVISSTSIQQVLSSTEAFIGFSAATGTDAEYHTVELWTFQGSYCTPDLHPGCSSFALNSCYCQVCSSNYVSNGNGGCYGKKQQTFYLLCQLIFLSFFFVSYVIRNTRDIIIFSIVFTQWKCCAIEQSYSAYIF